METIEQIAHQRKGSFIGMLDANICLDLLDTKRTTSKASIKWYMENKDDSKKEFYFSGNFITTIYYILTQKRKYTTKDTIDVIDVIDALSSEIIPCYINHNDFEDLIILNSAKRIGCDLFITNDKELLEFENFRGVRIIANS